MQLGTKHVAILGAPVLAVGLVVTRWRSTAAGFENDDSPT